jgi:hypothetical protein
MGGGAILRLQQGHTSRLQVCRSVLRRHTSDTSSTHSHAAGRRARPVAAVEPEAMQRARSHIGVRRDTKAITKGSPHKRRRGNARRRHGRHNGTTTSVCNTYTHTRHRSTSTGTGHDVVQWGVATAKRSDAALPAMERSTASIAAAARRGHGRWQRAFTTSMGTVAVSAVHEPTAENRNNCHQWSVARPLMPITRVAAGHECMVAAERVLVLLRRLLGVDMQRCHCVWCLWRSTACGTTTGKLLSPHSATRLRAASTQVT